MDNKTLGFLLIAMAGIYYVSNNNSGSSENTFMLPDGRVVKESELPDLGYVKLYGHWITQQQYNAMLSANNLNTMPQQGTPNYWTLINTLVTSGLGLLVNTVNNTAQARAEAVDNIYFKYMVSESANYDATFPYTKNQMLQDFTLKQLNQILAGNYPLTGVSGFEQNYFSKTIKSLV